MQDFDNSESTDVTILELKRLMLAALNQRTPESDEGATHLGWVGLPTQLHLHELLKTGQTKRMVEALSKMRRARQQGSLSVTEYKHLLIGPSQAQLTALDKALDSGKIDTVIAYLTEVKRAVTTGWLNPKHYHELLTHSDWAGCTPLHRAANSNNLEICDYFVSILEAESEEGTTISLVKELWRKTREGRIPACGMEKQYSRQINDFLDQKRRQYSAFRNQVEGRRHYVHAQQGATSTDCWQEHNNSTLFSCNAIRPHRVHGTMYYVAQPQIGLTYYQQGYNGNAFFTPNSGHPHQVNGTTYYFNSQWGGSSMHWPQQGDIASESPSNNMRLRFM